MYLAGKPISAVTVMPGLGSGPRPRSGRRSTDSNARDVKNVPGRPKTGRLDAVWLAKLAERGMLRPSFVPPPWQRELRDLCRYRRTLIQERTREKQRAEKLLEDAQIKLSSVISDIFGVSGREMLEALTAGQRDPYVLARMARGSMRKKISVLQEALTGHFRDHHGYLLRMMLQRTERADRPDRGADRADRGADRADRGGDRPFRSPGGPAR